MSFPPEAGFPNILCPRYGHCTWSPHCLFSHDVERLRDQLPDLNTSPPSNSSAPEIADDAVNNGEASAELSDTSRPPPSNGHAPENADDALNNVEASAERSDTSRPPPSNGQAPENADDAIENGEASATPEDTRRSDVESTHDVKRLKGHDGLKKICQISTAEHEDTSGISRKHPRAAEVPREAQREPNHANKSIQQHVAQLAKAEPAEITTAPSTTRKLGIQTLASQKTNSLRTSSSTTQDSLRSAEREVSPPPLRGKAPEKCDTVAAGLPTAPTERVTLAVLASERKIEPLSPRHIKNQIVMASFSKRDYCLKALFDQLQRLNANSKAKPSGDQAEGSKTETADDKAAAVPTDCLNIHIVHRQDLIRLALDEEEYVARRSPRTYHNMMANRLHGLRKMKDEEWRRIRTACEVPAKKATNAQPQLEADLALLMLNRFTAQLPLTFHGSRSLELKQPTQEERTTAAAALKAAAYWEKCCRCESRFQAFPEGRESDGALTSRGECTHHYGRREKTEINDGSYTKVAYGVGGRKTKVVWDCCGKEIGDSAGCEKAPCHVFKVSDPKRLSLTLNYIDSEKWHAERAPNKPYDPDSDHHITTVPDSRDLPKTLGLDCEMCYTTLGLECTRVTATDWPSGATVIDLLVKPYGKILDYNTRFSGITSTIFENATPLPDSLEPINYYPPYSPLSAQGHTTTTIDDVTETSELHIVESPAAARAIVLKFLHPAVYLLGHALENDLNVLRILHPRIVDTSLLYTSTFGPNYRPSLRHLALEHLKRRIQTGGSVDPVGHDSREDARAAGDLVMALAVKEWNKMKNLGWKFVLETDEKEGGGAAEPSLEPPPPRTIGE